MAKFSTILIHGGNQLDKANNALFPTITTASSFIQQNIDVNGEFSYSRIKNPTRYAYEMLLADIEKGIYATATASGVAATLLVLNLLPQNSHIIAMQGVYGGTYRIFEKLIKETSGHQVDYIDLNNLQLVKQHLRNNTRLIWIESPTNPLLELVNISKICQLAKENNIITCVDNTFATAWNQKPLELGADIVMLSTSKYIGGHSDLIGGAVITNQSTIADKIDVIKTTIGAIASPFDAYLALRGLKTLDLRMTRQCANALTIAKFLNNHRNITKVYYPGLSDNPQYHICQTQMKTGGAVVTININSNRDNVKNIISKLQYFVLAESLGGVESMVNHSATMSHAAMPEDERVKMGIYDTTLRLSVGIEDIDDLLNDLEQALNF
ncbi:trans-sulfuration enzyme family protein [Arsenophonus sp.]|uniref:trans-sulfuration enzyme family protein n=1 Tax=Arsenophonus sp. TaxID=1872640 RepID=UPI00387970BF